MLLMLNDLFGCIFCPMASLFQLCGAVLFSPWCLQKAFCINTYRVTKRQNHFLADKLLICMSNNVIHLYLLLF